MTTIVGLSGSLRRGSYNTALLRAAAGLAPDGVTLSVETIHGIPLYDGDAEAESGVPERAARLKDLIAAADGVLLVTPEYNNSIPGAFKNAIDWTTRPADDIARVWRGRPVGLIGASPGGFGTMLSQSAWLPVLRTLGTRPYFGGTLYVSRAGAAFGDDGAIADAALRDRLAQYLAGFAEFVEDCAG